jgi:hypothetical protein
MGYDFHITRGEALADGAALAIESDEWLKVAGSSEKFTPIALLPVTNLNLPPEWHSHCWHGHPTTDGKTGPIFQLVGGRIDFRGDDPATLGFALGLAQRLGAKVVGDEGEEITLAMVLGPSDDAFSDAVNPFTGERMVNEWTGVAACIGDELHLEVRSGRFLGFGGGRERFLLHFVVAAPDNPMDLHGSTLRLRGTLSEAGAYGAQRTCAKVLYVMKLMPP